MSKKTQPIRGSKSPWKLYAARMSDGTLRALGAIVATSQLAEGNVPVTLVGIEEPETALHPAASGALMDALREAATHTQVVVTTHSPELLDQFDPETDCLLSVRARQGKTDIGPIDPASRDAIKAHLYTAGDLLRMDQLDVDQDDLDRQEPMRLFEGAGAAE
jgi:predicted ATPase